MASNKYIIGLLLIKLLPLRNNNVKFYPVSNDSFINDIILVYAYSVKSLNYFFYTAFKDNNSDL